MKSKTPKNNFKLDAYLNAGIIDELDLSIAKMLLKNEIQPKDEWAFFACHLSKAFRMGALSVEICENTLSPSVELLWKNDEGRVIPKSCLELTEMIIKGSQIPLNPYIVKDGSHTYFLRAYNYIQQFIDSFKAYLQAEKRVFKDLSKAIETIHCAANEGLLQEKQKEACLVALESQVTLIMGGPGTGKTYTAAHIVKALQQTNADIQISLAAPTGKAASNLKSALAKVISMDGIDEPKTLHSLLNLPFKSKTIKAPYQLGYDLFIIDEASMIDMDMMCALLSSMKPSSRLILLGDPNQLPPVDLGSPFSDIAEAKITLPQGLKAIELETCMRCESLEVIDLAQKILKGSKEEIVDFFKTPKTSVELIEINTANTFALQEEIVTQALKKYEPMITNASNPALLFSCQKTFTILTPFRVGNLGSDALNLAISHRMVRHYDDQKLALPIMVRENRADLGLYNGDLGFLVHDGENKIGLFPSLDGHRSIPELLLPLFEYAFCLSIHKSQGSEFSEALILIPEGSENFGKKILYTALTRVKKRALIYSKIDLLCTMANTNASKNSGIAGKLQQIC